MSNCSCKSDSSNKVLKPNFSCAPDFSQLLFKFIDRKSIGLVKGNIVNSAIDMSNFFIPIESYSMNTIGLCKDETQLIQLGSRKSRGPVREITTIDLSGIFFIPTSRAKIRLLDENDNLISETVTNYDPINNPNAMFPADDFDMFIANLKSELPNDFKKEYTFLSSTSLPNILKMIAVSDGKIYKIEIDVETVGIITTYTEDDFPISNITKIPVFKYPDGAFKVLMLFSNFCQDCITSSENYIEYAYVSSPNVWRKMGPLLLLSGADDATEEDTNLIENIYIKNPHDCGVNIQVIIGL